VARELAELAVWASPAAVATPVDTTIRHLRLGGPADALASLAAAIRAPHLRRLDIAQRDADPDGLARVFDSPWLDTATHLELDGEHVAPWLGAVRRTDSRLRTLTLRRWTPAVLDLLDWRGLRDLRVLTTDTSARMPGDALARLLASSALGELVALKVAVTPGGLAELASAAVPPKLRHLELFADELSDAEIEALARWPGARQLASLDLGWVSTLGRGAVDVLTDRTRFPSLELFGAWPPELPAEDIDRLRARFGPPVFPLARGDSFFGLSWNREA
jgi:hypothetical protein